MRSWFSKRQDAISSIFHSEVGLVRVDNQDRVYADDGALLYVVADGMGGGAEGGKAAEWVVEALKEEFFYLAPEVDFVGRVEAARQALIKANRRIYEYASLKHYRQMGSTAVALLINPQDHTQGAVLWVGDSRLYRIRNGRALQLTVDHRFGFTNALTRSIGVMSEVLVDIREVSMKAADRMFLCSDGVHGVVSNPRLGGLLKVKPLKRVADAVSAAVLEGGAPDNFTFIAVQA